MERYDERSENLHYIIKGVKDQQVRSLDFSQNIFTRPPPLEMEDFKEVHVHVTVSAHQNLWTTYRQV